MASTPKKRAAKKSGPSKQVDKKIEIREKAPKEKDFKEIKEKEFKDHKDKPEVKEHKIEGKENKNEKIEHKEFKIEAKEHGKVEKIEIKEHKIEKNEKVELKDQGKEIGKEGGKEGGKIEIKDGKEGFKEVFDKLTPENPKDLVEGGGPVQVDPGDPAISAGLAQRVANLEGQVATFISGANRPDLSTGALKNEADQTGKSKK